MTAAAQSQGRDPSSSPVGGAQPAGRCSCLVPHCGGEVQTQQGPAPHQAWWPWGSCAVGWWSDTAGRVPCPAPWLPATTWLTVFLAGLQTVWTATHSVCRQQVRALPLPHVQEHLPSSARAPSEAGRRAFSQTAHTRPTSGPQSSVLGARRDVAWPLLLLLELSGLEKQPHWVQGTPSSWGARLWSKACATRWPSASPKFTSLTGPEGKVLGSRAMPSRAWKDAPSWGTGERRAKTTVMTPRASEATRHWSFSDSTQHTLSRSVRVVEKGEISFFVAE